MENRLIYYTQANINALQQNAGITPTLQPVAGSLSARGLSTATPVTAQPHTVANTNSQGKYVGNITNDPINANGLTPQQQSQSDSDHFNAATGGNATHTGLVYDKTLTDALDAVDQKYAAMNAAGQTINPQDREAEKQTAIQLHQAQQQNMQAQQAQDKANIQPTTPVTPTPQTGGASAPAPIVPMNGNRFQGASDAAPDRQSYIESRRAEGATDAQIRHEINTLPPEQTGGATTTPPAGGTPSTTTPTNTTTPPATSGTTTPPASTTPATNPDGTPVTPTTTTPAPIPPAASAAADAIYAAAVAAGDPMAGVTRAIYLQAAQDTANENAAALTTKNASIAGADQGVTDVNAFIDKMTAKAQASQTSLDNLLQTTTDATEKTLSAQKDTDLAKNQLAQDQAVQQQERAKTQDILKQSISMALSGGSFSGAGQAALADSERNWDNQISQLSKSYDLNAATISNTFTQNYVAAQNKLSIDLFNAADNYNKVLDGYSAQGFNSLEAAKTAKAKALSDYQTTVDTNTKALSTTVNGMAKDLGAAIDTINKAKVQQKQFDITNQTKQDAINAANTNRTTQQGIAAGVHDDAMTQTDSAGIQTAIGAAQSKLAASTGDYAIYNNVTAFKQQFDSAYGDFMGINPLTGQAKIDPKTGKPVVATAGQRATADGQMAFQFSHSQNPGSLRIQDIAAAMAEGNQSVADKITATIQQAANGGGVLTDDIRNEMHTLVAQHYADAQAAATNQILTEWSTLQAANINYPKARKAADPTMLTTDPVLLNAMYKTQNTGLSNFLHGGAGGAVTAPAPLQSFRSEVSSLGTVTQDFNTAVNYTKSGEHGAIDIAMKQGANIPAFSDGKVVLVQNGGDLGNHVEVKDANGYTHIYAHLSGTTLKVGDTVTAGAEIGLAGHTGHTNRNIDSGGSSTGDHLHYQINGLDGKPVDPYSYYGDKNIQVASNYLPPNSTNTDTLLQIALEDTPTQ